MRVQIGIGTSNLPWMVNNCFVKFRFFSCLFRNQMIQTSVWITLGGYDSHKFMNQQMAEIASVIFHWEKISQLMFALFKIKITHKQPFVLLLMLVFIKKLMYFLGTLFIWITKRSITGQEIYYDQINS